MEIERPYFLIFLIFSPLPFIFNSSKLIFRFSSFSLLPKDHWSNIIQYSIKFLSSLVIGLLALALSDIKIPDKLLTKSYKEGAEIVFVLDESGSMDSELISGGTKKIDVARNIISEIIKKLENDRLALVIFGSTSAIASPRTFDKNTILKILEKQTPDLGGTVFSSGFLRAISIFHDKNDLNHDQFTRKIIIFFSDGEGSLDYDDYIEYWMKKLAIDFYWININNTSLGTEAEIFPNKMQVKHFLQKFDQRHTYLLEINELPKDAESILAKINSRPRTKLKQSEEISLVHLKKLFTKTASFLIVAILFMNILEFHSMEKVVK